MRDSNLRQIGAAAVWEMGKPGAGDAEEMRSLRRILKAPVGGSKGQPDMAGVCRPYLVDIVSAILANSQPNLADIMLAIPS